MIAFTVYGTPQAQGRPRSGKTPSGDVVMYDPTNSKEYKRYVGLIASQHRPKELIDSAVSLTVKVFLPIPRSWSKKKQNKADSGEVKPTSKPDIDNLSKSIMDSLSGIIWVDDKQVVNMVVEKRYSNSPRVEVGISELL